MRGLRLLYLGLGTSTAALNPFLVPILKQHGFDPGTIGLVMAFGAAGIFLGGPIWGHIGDYVIGRRRTLLAVAAVACAMALAIAGPVSAPVLAVLIVCFQLSQGSITGLCDSLAVSNLDNPRRDYGRIRMMASLSFGLVSIPFGFLYDRTGYTTAPSFVFVAAVCFLAAAAALVPDHRPRRETPTAGPAQLGSAEEAAGRSRAPRPMFGSTGLAFHLQPRLFGVLVVVFLTWFAVMNSFIFLGLRIVDLGGQPSDVALSFGIAAFGEIPGLLIGARLVRYLGLRGLFFVGTIGFALTFLSWTVLDRPADIIASRVLTGVCYGGMMVAMVLTIGEILPPALQATGQTLYQATAAGLASVVGTAIGGQLYGLIGAPFLFAVCAGFMLAGGLLGLAILPARVRRVDVSSELDDVVLPNTPVV